MPTPMDYALTSVSRLHGMLLDRMCGKPTPQILLDEELKLLTKRINALQEPEATVFDLTAFRERQRAWESDEIPLAAHGVEELSDE